MIRIALLILVVACTALPDPSGRWVLWSVDAVPVRDAAPVRSALPAEIDPGFSAETYTDSLWLDLVDGGDYRQVSIERRVIVASRSAIEAVTGALWTGPEVVREEEQPIERVVLGHWVQNGDSIFLYPSVNQLRERMLQSLGAALPGASRADLQAQVDSLVAGLGATPSQAGRVQGSRLELRDPNGRVMVYHRVP